MLAETVIAFTILVFWLRSIYAIIPFVLAIYLLFCPPVAWLTVLGGVSHPVLFSLPLPTANQTKALGRAQEPVRQLYLTIDDAPSAHTDIILQALYECRCKALFFVIGQYARQHPDVLREIVKQGFVRDSAWLHQRFCSSGTPLEIMMIRTNLRPRLGARLT